MIVDFRGRPPTEPFLKYFDRDFVAALAPRFGARALSPAFLEGSLDRFIAEMDEAGVAVAVAIGRNSPAVRTAAMTLPEGLIDNQHLVDLQERFPGRIVGFAGIDVSNRIHDAVREVEIFVGKRGLKGVFIEPQRAFAAHPDALRCDPVYDLCQALDVPVSIMTGPLAGSDIGFADPAPIDRVASRFPKLKIVCGHGCWPRVSEMIAVAFKHPNVFVSPDVYQFAPGSQLYIDAANGFMADQYLFGTAYPVLALKETVERFKALPFHPTAREKALYGNARRLLKLA